MTLAAGLMGPAPSQGAEPRFALHLSPLALLMGAVDVEGELRLGRRWSAGPLMTYWRHRADGDELGLVAAGARLDWHARHAFADGWYASVFAKHWWLEVENQDVFGDRFRGAAQARVLGILGGYQWRLNAVTLKAGAGYTASTAEPVTLHADSGASRDYDPSKAPMLGGYAFDFSLAWLF